ncbi:MAG: hypothetical protein IH831_06800 [Planctomycetes bacterium]|nr:hypothetical protein [Planctomycetota bacterium]
MSLELQAGWYAVVFGSGLFGTSGKGAAVRNGEDLDNPSFFSWQPGALGDGWFDLDVFPPEFSGNLRFVVEGTIIPEPISLALDIKPGSDENPVNLKSRGVLPVAVLSTDDFDTSDIDVETLLFGDPLLLDVGGMAAGPLRFAFEDVSDDGLVDLTLKFSLPELIDLGALGPESIAGLLTGTLFDGTPIEGADSIRIVPSNGTNVNSFRAGATPEPSSFLLAATLLTLLSTTARCRF